MLAERSLQQGGFLARCLVANTRAEPQFINREAHTLSGNASARWETLLRDLLVSYRRPANLPTGDPEPTEPAL